VKSKLEIGNKVLLKSFNGTTVPDENTQPNENYWKHNNVENSLWINVKDLEILKDKI
jgi:hypothetical protein